MHIVLRSAALLAAISSPGICSAQDDATKLDTDLEEIVVVGRSVSTTSATITVERELLVDTATILKEIPGANVNANGPITGLAQYRGLHGDRVAVSIDQQGVISGGPNAMDAPLSYVSPMITDELIVQRGIASVSLAAESLGGHINTTIARGSFANDDFGVAGLIGSRLSSNGGVSTSAARLTLANQQNRVSLIAELDNGDDVQTPAGVIRPSRLDRERYDVSYAFESSGSKLLLFIGKLDTRDTGTAALPMDIIGIDTDLYGVQFSKVVTPLVEIAARVSYNEVLHLMDNFSLRTVASPMRARENTAAGSGTTFNLSGLFDLGESSLRLGLDGILAAHDSVITNPNMAMFQVDNFADVERDLFSAFAEWRRGGDTSNLEIGLRYKQVETSAGLVGASGMPGMMQMPANALADAFNNSNRDLNWDSIDAMVKYRHSISSNVEWNIDLGSKTRAPWYQELYLWLPLQATGGLADGRTYIGNLDLVEERSNEIVIGVSADVGRVALSPQIFYRRIDNYIQGIPSTNAVANMLSVMMTGAPALQFENVDAEIWGLDLAWKVDLTDRIFIDGILSLADGQQTDADDYLYRLAPLNASVGLTFDAASWSIKTEFIFNAKQDRVSEFNGEQETGSYGLVNIGFAWDPISSLRVEARVENLLNETYQDHLAGVNRAMGGDIMPGTRLYGIERAYTAGLIYRF